MKLRALRTSDMGAILEWRNSCLPTLRTSFPLTYEQQCDWYKNEICNRGARTRFWAIVEELDGTDCLVGYGGIENIQWENSIGEISLLIDPCCHGHGYGTWAANEIIETAFDELGLFTVYAECYENNPAVGFWRKVFSKYHGTEAILPNRKYCGGRYHASRYFSASK